MASAKTRTCGEGYRSASLQTPLICGHKKTEGLKAPGYSFSRLSDVFSLTTHYSLLITHYHVILNLFQDLSAEKN